MRRTPRRSWYASSMIRSPSRRRDRAGTSRILHSRRRRRSDAWQATAELGLVVGVNEEELPQLLVDRDGGCHHASLPLGGAPDATVRNLVDLARREIHPKLAELDFEVTGFDTVDADRLLGPEPDPLGRKSGSGELSSDPDDDVPPLETEGPSLSQSGDMWDLGSHRVLHGDALDPRSYEVLLGDDVATQIVTDPPYNVPNRGHVSSMPFREFPMAAGEMSPREFSGFLTRAFSLAARTARDGAIFHVFMDWHHLAEMQTAIGDAGLDVKNLCVGPNRRPAWEASIGASTN